MEQHLLKKKILEQIKERKVTAALFYTFNFEPVFFENYVLPLLMPKSERENFTDNPITNQMLWREYHSIMPDITVYCDDYAKSKHDAPTLGYEIRCVRVPCAKGAITNFHLKHIFLLLEDETLLFINGSGNLTPNGWCRNVEIFSIEVLKTVAQSNHNPLVPLISKVATLYPSGKKTIAEERIEEVLQKCNGSDLPYFNSFETDLQSFITENVLNKEKHIEFVEIVSPYFSPTDKLIEFLLNSKSNIEIRFLLPKRHNEVNLEKWVFELLDVARVTWHDWTQKDSNERCTQVTGHDRTQKDLNERYTHAKIYRFVGKKQVYTILGSVNFTEPAWRKYAPSDNKENIEAAMLYQKSSKKDTNTLLDPKKVSTENMLFIHKKELEAAEDELDKSYRNAPNMSFIIDWKAKTLKYEFIVETISSTKPIPFNNYKFEKTVLCKSSEIQLEGAAFKKLVKNSLIEITEQTQKGVISYFYYPKHENFVKKPLSKSLSSDEIMDNWLHLGDEKYIKKIIDSLGDRANEEEETGEVSVLPLIFNRWALAFSGLVNLERNLFGENQEKDKIEFYLMRKGFATIPNYLDELCNEYENKKLYNNFYWMILQIICQNFYGNMHIPAHLKLQAAEQQKDLEAQIQKVQNNLSDFKSNKSRYDFLKEQIKFNP
jgi:hypothetical protein